MRTVMLATGLATLALAACSSEPTVTAKDASPAEVAAKVKAAGISGSFVSAGHWDTVMQITDVSVPGAPPAMAQQMKTAMGKPRTIASCLTEEQAKRPAADFFGKGQGSCKYDRFEMGGGRISGVMTCTMAGASRTMTMDSTYSPDAYAMTVVSTGKGGESPMAAMGMTIKMTARRTGACTGTEGRDKS